MPVSAHSVLTSYQARPAAYRLSSPSWPVEVSEKFKEWKWVLVHELIACLHATLARNGSKWAFTSAHDLFFRFALINKRIEAEDVGLFTWVSRTTFGLHERSAERFPEASEAIYMPERWSNLIIEMVEQGIVAISSRPDVRDGGRVCGHDLIAHFPDKSMKWLHWQGHDKYKLYDMPKPWQK